MIRIFRNGLKAHQQEINKYTMSNKSLIKVLICVSILSLILPFLLTRESFCAALSFSDTGEIGDTISGTTAPLIGLLNAFLLFLTIKEQYIFNAQQKKDSYDAQFKDTFFTLLQNQLNVVDKINGSFYFLTHEGTYSRDIAGKDFFPYAVVQLRNIYKALESSKYLGHYDEEFDLAEYYSEMSEPIAQIPDEAKFIEESYKIKYTNLIYFISNNNYNKYKTRGLEDKIGIIYIHFYNRYEVIGVYFRHLYNILKYIDSSEKEAIEKFAHNINHEEEIKNQYKQYAQFIQAQMSNEELCLLFYNSFLFKKMQRLIIKYNLLENLPIESLINKDHNCKKEMNLKSKRGLFKEFMNRKILGES